LLRKITDREPVLTLQELIDMAKASAAPLRSAGEPVCRPENPDYFRSPGLPVETPLIEVLAANGLSTPDATDVLVQVRSEGAKIGSRGRVGSVVSISRAAPNFGLF